MDFKNAQELLEICESQGKTIAQVALEREMYTSGLSREEVIAKMTKSFEIMRNSIHKGLEEELKSLGGLIGGEGRKVKKRLDEGKSIIGDVMSKAVAASLAVLEVNATMGLVVAAPTAGSCGIMPASIIVVGEAFGKTDEEMVTALLTASAIGLIVTKNATVSGAEGGCQAETGTASAMAAAGIVEMMGGTPSQAIHAGAITFKNIMGLVCDPIAGLVEAPCQKRNAIGTANSLISAEMALAGIESIIPFDEVVEAMYKVGRSLPFELRETALGGVAATPTGCRLTKQIFK